MLSKLAHTLWGNVTAQQLKKFSILSLALLFIISACEIMRPTKDVLFLATVGKTLLPHAKIVSLLVLVVFLMLYAKFVDWFEKHVLVYILSSIISLFLFMLAAVLAQMPHIYQDHSLSVRCIGWVTLVGIECSIVMLFTLYWSFLSSSMDTSTAKKGYPLIIAGARIGSIIGPVATFQANNIGIILLLVIAGCCVLAEALCIKWFTSISSNGITDTKTIDQIKTTGALEGLRLLIKHPYLMGIFLISILPDIIGEFLIFSMLFLAENYYKTPTMIISFLGMYGIAVSCTSLIFALFCSSFFLRRWGLGRWLLVYPMIISIIIFCTWQYYNLWSITIGCILFKSFGYAFDQPCRDILLIPTSKDIIFKTRSWINAFGARFARGVSSGLVIFFSPLGSFIFYSSLTSFCLIFLWVPLAQFVGNKNTELIQESTILE